MSRASKCSRAFILTLILELLSWVCLERMNSAVCWPLLPGPVLGVGSGVLGVVLSPAFHYHDTQRTKLVGLSRIILGYPGM